MCDMLCGFCNGRGTIPTEGKNGEVKVEVCDVCQGTGLEDVEESNRFEKRRKPNRRWSDEEEE